MGFREEAFIGKNGGGGWAAVCLALLWLVGGEVTGWYSRNLSLLLPTSLGSAGLCSAWSHQPQLAGGQIFTTSPGRSQSQATSQQCCFLLHFFTPRSTNSAPLELSEGTGAETLFLPARNGGHTKAFVPGRPPLGPARFQHFCFKGKISIRSYPLGS